MVPRRLLLRNFLCYREACEPIDFTGLDLVCLTGENGHGKSSLLDAMTWALWGKARGKRDDDLIHLGRAEALVELEFYVGEALYRVSRRRKRATGNSPGRSALDLFVYDGEKWHPLNGVTISETERKIVDLLHIDYETFRNSAFLAQGNAGEFTSRTPAERKDVLGKILDLEVYDRYQKVARAKAADLTRELAVIEDRIAFYAAEIAKEPRLVREAEETRRIIAEREADLKEVRARLELIRANARVVDELRKQRQRLENELADARRRAHDARREAEEAEQQRGEYATILARAEEIERLLAEYRQQREIIDVQSERLQRITGLQRRRAEVARRIDVERERLKGEIARLEREVARLAQAIETAREADNALRALDDQRKQLERDEQRLGEIQQQRREITQRIGELLHENEQFKKRGKELQEKRATLDSGVEACPFCGAPLDDEGRERLRREYAEEGEQLNERFKRNRAECQRLQDTERELAAEEKALQEETRKLRTSLGAQEGSLRRQVADGAAAAREAPEIEGVLARAREALVGETFAAEDRTQLAALDAEIAAVGYDPGAHQAAQARLAQLKGVEEQARALERAREGLGHAEERLRGAQARLAEWTRIACEKEQEAETVVRQLQDYAGIDEQLRAAEEETRQNERAVQDAQRALGAVEQQLAQCARYRQERDRLAAQRQEYAARREIYDTLDTAFGKRGVQAMLIEAALPEIEDEANRLLDRMTGGRMTVALTTQRTTQKGETRETLEIEIADELGTRPYELYSGGEAFRIDLALRIALAKLLARRAGAPLPTLIIDEGFGTQDAHGCDRLIDAIQSIASDFRIVIVITHLDELKSRFERRIVVEKTVDGSIARVV